MQETLRKDFISYVGAHNKTIADIAKETNLNVRTLYNWLSSNQKLSKQKLNILNNYLKQQS